MKSESIKELATALAKAQAEMKNPHFDQVNPHFKSKFASLAAVREAVIPILAKHGISLSQWPLCEGNNAGCRTVLAHASGEWIEESFLIPVDKQSAHGYASALTYAKRLSMQAVVGVVGDEDDDGNGAVGDKKDVPRISGAAVKRDHYDELSEDQRAWIDDLAGMVNSLVEAGKVDEALAEIDYAIPEIGEKRHPYAAEYKTALASKLGSKVSAALKKARIAQKETA